MDFGGAREATIFQGDKRGNVFNTSLSDFTEYKWQAVGASARYGADFPRARPEQTKEASFMPLEKHVKYVMVAEGLHPLV